MPNSVATGGTLMACNCVTGKVWDVMTLGCIDICWANNPTCVVAWIFRVALEKCLLIWL
jgi:hypothetical protein